jgi:hypothetical protein
MTDIDITDHPDKIEVEMDGKVGKEVNKITSTPKDVIRHAKLLLKSDPINAGVILQLGAYVSLSGRIIGEKDKMIRNLAIICGTEAAGLLVLGAYMVGWLS